MGWLCIFPSYSHVPPSLFLPVSVIKGSSCLQSRGGLRELLQKEIHNKNIKGNNTETHKKQMRAARTWSLDAKLERKYMRACLLAHRVQGNNFASKFGAEEQASLRPGKKENSAGEHLQRGQLVRANIVPRGSAWAGKGEDLLVDPSCGRGASALSAHSRSFTLSEEAKKIGNIDTC